MDDFCHLTLKKRVKQFDQKQQTRAESSQGGSQEDEAYCEIWQLCRCKQMSAYKKSQMPVILGFFLSVGFNFNFKEN